LKTLLKFPRIDKLVEFAPKRHNFSKKNPNLFVEGRKKRKKKSVIAMVKCYLAFCIVHDVRHHHSIR
jgi:hypothetical protein